MPYYAVANGRETGVYNSWGQCEQQVKGYSGAQFKKFDSMAEAHQFAAGQTTPSSSYATTGSGYSGGNTNRCASGSSFGASSSYCYGGYSGAPASYSSQNSSAASKFTRNSSGYVECYTDGSCESNGREGARAGKGVWFGNNHPLNIAEPVKGRPTNNVAEIEAATEAVRMAKSHGIGKLQINTDSQFMIKSTTEWMPKWKENDWQLSTGGEVKNREQFMELDRAIRESGVDVKWNYVPAHSGIDGNERADRLAKQGAAKYTSN